MKDKVLAGIFGAVFAIPALALASNHMEARRTTVAPPRGSQPPLGAQVHEAGSPGRAATNSTTISRSTTTSRSARALGWQEASAAQRESWEQKGYAAEYIHTKATGPKAVDELHQSDRENLVTISASRIVEHEPGSPAIFSWKVPVGSRSVVVVPRLLNIQHSHERYVGMDEKLVYDHPDREPLSWGQLLDGTHMVKTPIYRYGTKTEYRVMNFVRLVAPPGRTIKSVSFTAYPGLQSSYKVELDP
jgi:hypothetical protein